MRICPKCRHTDYPWKHRAYTLFIDYCHIEELEQFNKSLSLELRRAPKFYTDGTFNYRLKPDGFVFRIWKLDARHPTSLQEPPCEPHKKIPSKNQTKLLGAKQK